MSRLEMDFALRTIIGLLLKQGDGNDLAKEEWTGNMGRGVCVGMCVCWGGGGGASKKGPWVDLNHVHWYCITTLLWDKTAQLE